MDAEVLRNAIKNTPLPISSIAFEANIDRHRLRAFLDGNDRAITDAEFEATKSKLQADDSKTFKNIQMNEAVADGIMHMIQSHSLAFFYASATGELRIASGTLVQLGESVFVATAGHVVHKTTMIQFVGENTVSFHGNFDEEQGIHNVQGGTNIPVKRSGKHSYLDIGFFELNERGPSELSRKPLTVDRIANRPLEYGRMTYIYGYPSQLVKPQLSGLGSSRLSSGSSTYMHALLAPEEWPDVPEGSDQPCETIDCFVHYDVEDRVIRTVTASGGKAPPPGLPESLPDAGGMSGGGFWQGWQSRDDLWDPTCYQLAAIQSSWYKPGKYLRAIQSQHWLNLVRDKCSDLSKFIPKSVN